LYRNCIDRAAFMQNDFFIAQSTYLLPEIAVVIHIYRTKNLHQQRALRGIILISNNLIILNFKIQEIYLLIHTYIHTYIHTSVDSTIQLSQTTQPSATMSWTMDMKA
jgi:hypothetical protein